MIEAEQVRNSLFLVGLGAGCIAAPILGVNMAAKGVFGLLAGIGASRTSLLPLLFFANEGRAFALSEAVCLSIIGFGGLHLLTDADPLNFAIPAAIATWFMAGEALSRQGLQESVGNNKDFDHWVWGALYFRCPDQVGD
jgi:hypothetical protein